MPVPVPYVDVLCAGWPCPGFSVAGRGEGFDHEGSGLWVEVIRLVRELGPRYVVLENVSALLARGLWRVLETWPRAGMTRNGTAYQLRPLAPLTRGTASGLLPTPAATEYGSSQKASTERANGSPSAGTPSLGTMARHGTLPDRIPTPTAGDSRNSRNATAGRSPGSAHHPGVTLSDYIRMWPTPQARDAQGRSTPMPDLAANRYAQGKRCLEDAVSLAGSPGGMLNPTWVEWLMGFPLGWTDLEASETPSSPRSRSGLEGES